MIITVLQNRCFEEDRESEAWKAVGFEGREGIFKDNPEKGWKPEFINEFSPIATKEITPSKENGIMTFLDACEMVFGEFQGQENTNPEWNIIEKSHRSLSVGDIVKLEGREMTGSDTKFFMVEGCGFSEFAPEEIAEDSSPDNGGDDRDAKIDAMQKQIDSLRAMVLEMASDKQRDLKRGHTLQGTNMWIEESNHHFAQRLVKLEEEFKSQLKSIWHDGVRGTRGQASLRGLNERLNGAEIALEKLEKKTESGKEKVTSCE